MKFLLSLFSISAVFATSILNTNLIFQTNSFVTNLKSKLKTKNNSLSFLYQDQPNNKLTKQFLAYSNFPYLANDPESSYFNDVLLKSIAYDKISLKLTSSLANLNNYDLKHHESKIDTYLDQQDYSKMMAIKNKKNSIINYNLVFLNHFFNNNALIFNPNGFIISRQKLLNANANSLKVKTQSVISLRHKKNQNILNNFLGNSNSGDLGLNISWSGISYHTGSKMLTQYILNFLNGAANLTNAATAEIQSVIKSNSNLYTSLKQGMWDPWDEEKMIRYIFEDQTIMQDTNEYPDVANFISESAEEFDFDTLDSKVCDALFNIILRTGSEPFKYFSEIYQKAIIRFGKDYLGYSNDNNLMEDDSYIDDSEVSEDAANYIKKFNNIAAKVNKDATVDASAEAEQTLGEEGANEVANEVAQAVEEGGASAEATADGVPIIGWIIGLIILGITTAIGIVLSVELKKVHNWKINIGNLSPKGSWSLNNLRFDPKTRLFRELNSSQIQFQGQYFKPWVGKLTHKVVSFKPLHAIKPNKEKTKKPSLDLMHQYNLLTGSNNNFNLIVNPTTWKQMVAAANMPSAQFSVKQVLAKNNVNNNNLYLSNQNWVDLIKQIKDPALNQNFAGDFKFQNSKLIYSNLTKNHQSNFKYQGDSYIKEMLVGNNSNQDLLLDNSQLKLLLQGLNYLKNRWNDSKAQTKTGKPLIPGIKNSIQYNPKNYQDFVTWYYYCQLKPYIWVDSNSSDQVNISFLKRIFAKLNSKKFKLSFKQGLNLINNDAIIDLSSSQF